MPDNIDTLFSEPLEKTTKRANNTLISGHHSVFEHPTYNLSLEGIPKILAMVLNNEKLYCTSEKSARYTKMECTPEEEKLYEKWIEIFKNQIFLNYPNFDEKRVQKLAQENARYLISVFTPSTVMEYTVNLRQLNYIINWAKDYIENDNNDDFSKKLKNVFKEFLKAMPDLEIPGLDSRIKNRKFSLFSERDSRNEEFGENYSTNYLASFADLAQAHRHRTLIYEMKLLDKPQYFIPPIIKDTKFEKEWIKDISSLEKNFPQGMLVQVNERGTIENFVLKCTERLCGFAQLEIMQQTHKTMQKYLKSVKTNLNYITIYYHIQKVLVIFPNWKCESPCMFGGKNAINRLI